MSRLAIRGRVWAKSLAGIAALAALGGGFSRAQEAKVAASSGVFTSEQSAAGETVYAVKCAACHSADLSGNDQASPLAGTAFLANWTGQSAADLATRIRTSMPADNPGSLGQAETVNLVAFLLKSNRFSPGAKPLPQDDGGLGSIVITDQPIK